MWIDYRTAFLAHFFFKTGRCLTQELHCIGLTDQWNFAHIQRHTATLMIILPIFISTQLPQGILALEYVKKLPWKYLSKSQSVCETSVNNEKADNICYQLCHKQFVQRHFRNIFFSVRKIQNDWERLLLLLHFAPIIIFDDESRI